MSKLPSENVTFLGDLRRAAEAMRDAMADNQQIDVSMEITPPAAIAAISSYYQAADPHVILALLDTLEQREPGTTQLGRGHGLRIAIEVLDEDGQEHAQHFLRCEEHLHELLNHVLTLLRLVAALGESGSVYLSEQPHAVTADDSASGKSEAP